MVKGNREFRTALRSVLLSEDGLSIESEATVFVRSLEGGHIVAGILDDDGGIHKEVDFEMDVDSAIDFFIRECSLRNLGSG